MRVARRVRKSGLVALACLLGAVANQGRGQVVVNQASTAGESYARGMSSAISAAGDYNLSTSQAAINMTQAQKQEIQNRQQWTNTYFEMREANREYRARERGPRPTTEQLVRFAQEGKPKPLSLSALGTDGRITWPDLLKDNVFADNREKIDGAFLKRAEQGGIGLEDQMTVRSATAAMLDQLKQFVRGVPPNLYTSAKQFLQSLAYEAQKAA